MNNQVLSAADTVSKQALALINTKVFIKVQLCLGDATIVAITDFFGISVCVKLEITYVRQHTRLIYQCFSAGC